MFGRLAGHYPSPIEEVGEAVGVTRERARQLEIKAILNLQRVIRYRRHPRTQAAGE